jgi:hypothetical protein
MDRISKLPAALRSLCIADPFVEKGASVHKGKRGVYVFFENGQPAYIGRTNNLAQRLRGHVRFSHNTASFAFKRAKEKLKIGKANYKSESSRKRLQNDPEFAQEFRRQIEAVRKMSVRFLEVEHHVDQYLLELYAAMSLGLPTAEFDNH